MENSRNRPSIDVTAFAQELLQSVLAAVPDVGDRPLKIWVGFSGGLDSSVLLDALWRSIPGVGAPVDLAAVHIHHGLSPNADAWANHCHQYCSTRSVSFKRRAVKVVCHGGESIESAARRLRYGVYSELDADLVVLGHHRDDQAETLMLNLLRGTSVFGAAAIPARRGRFFRPLLDVPKSKLHAYAVSCGLEWIEDESNQSLQFSRNFLRKEVFPALEARFPQASAHLAQAATHFAETQILLNDLAVIDGAAQHPLPLAALRGKSIPRALNVLAYHLRSQGVRVPSRRWLLESFQQLLDAAPDRQVRLQVDQHWMRRYRDQLVLEAKASEAPEKQVWNGSAMEVAWGRARILIETTTGKGIARHRLGTHLEFRTREGRERFETRPGLRRSLKDLMREAGIFPWLRHRLPLLFSDGELVWVPFVGTSQKYRCEPGEDGITLEFDEASW